MATEIFYHGTTLSNLEKICVSGYIGTEYFDGFGFYLSDDIEVAKNHGAYIISIPIERKYLTQDDVNYGFYYKGKLQITPDMNVMIRENDESAISDLIEYLMSDYGN